MNLATLLKRQGYATACIGKWYQGMSREAQADGTLKTTPVDFGFGYYFGFDAPEQGPYAFIENKRLVVAPAETIEDHLGEVGLVHRDPSRPRPRKVTGRSLFVLIRGRSAIPFLKGHLQS